MKYIDSNFNPHYFCNGEIIKIFELKKEHFSSGEISLNFNIIDMEISCNFFEEEQVQFTFNPRDVKNEKNFNYLLNFIRNISNISNTNFIITEENIKNYKIIEYNCKNKTFYDIDENSFNIDISSER
ncbi:hypothetical protein [Pigmentibacter ruber]|uniref:hypothetical protein n=1 Tax=Pigmentibacter ruber TaxID=2683196 RepID=UPI00131E0408|nr:hypothetical protein [Pigmentibacter ruber]